ncbi:MAG: type I-C CRISPR-associated protein Cas8c/Csd1, partial [Lachnospiraceae bacterium]
MGYWQDLNETYEYAKKWVGKPDGKDTILLPIAHSTQNAQIEVMVNLRGDFKSARKVEKARAVTVIPVTEDSGSRSSGIAPHPLHDKLCYVAGDYAAYCDKKKADEYYQSYIRQLEDWKQHGCHAAVEAVYRYLRRACLIQDLIGEKVLETDENGKLREDVKIEGIAQTEAFVRFLIQDVDYSGVGEIWTDTEIYEDYQKYYLTRVGEADLDYITGEYVTCAEKQPSKIRNSADKAKLISANDNDGFTYRGRFADRKEALSIGYVSSQQAHNALRWLIERQGYRKYGSCIVVWNPHDHEVPEWNQEPEDFFENEEDTVPVLEIAEKYAVQVRKALNGRYADIATPGECVIAMELDAATPGRLAVVYYNKVSGSQFLKNMTDWYADCAWNLSYLKKRGNYPRTPIPEDIIRAAYGVERNGNLDVDEKLMNDKLKQLLPCIVAGKDIPADIYQAVIQNASRPLAYEAFNRRKIQE